MAIWERSRIVLALLPLVLAACGERAKLTEDASVGPNPALPQPVSTLFPTVDIAPAIGWTEGNMPTPAPGFAVVALAKELDHPRWLYVLPNGDVLVAETNAPERPERTGFVMFVMSMVMRRAGAGGESANRITLLRDADGDGVAEVRSVFLEGLNSPFGMALIGDGLYVANTDAVMRFPYTEGATRIGKSGTQVALLPGGPLNHHWTKGLTASPDGAKLYASVGSNSNIAENGMDKEGQRAAIIEIDVASGDTRVFASGLRNPVGVAFKDTELWTVVNERDEIGSDLVPDYLTSVKEGGFYGWPYSYYGNHVDSRVEQARPDLVVKAIAPDFALGTHVAPLGLAFSLGNATMPERFRDGAFVGLHGSWNRTPPNGYKVVFVPFVEGKPQGRPIDILTGFLSKNGDAFGRPVGVEIDRRGALLIADDVGNTVWRVVPQALASAN